MVGAQAVIPTCVLFFSTEEDISGSWDGQIAYVEQTLRVSCFYNFKQKYLKLSAPDMIINNLFIVHKYKAAPKDVLEFGNDFRLVIIFF